MALKPINRDVDPHLYPNGGWKLILIKTNPDNYNLAYEYRCVSCRSTSPEKLDLCPGCGKQMKYDPNQSEGGGIE